MTAPNVSTLNRVLSPDEFEHAQALTPRGLRAANFPPVPPPFAPRDDTRVTPARPGTAGPQIPPPGEGLMARVFHAAAYMVEHPFETAKGVVMAPLEGAYSVGRFIGQPIADALEP